MLGGLWNIFVLCDSKRAWAGGFVPCLVFDGALGKPMVEKRHLEFSSRVTTFVGPSGASMWSQGVPVVARRSCALCFVLAELRTTYFLQWIVLVLALLPWRFVLVVVLGFRRHPEDFWLC